MKSLKDWLARHLPFIEQKSPSAPRGIVLVGLPGTGKHAIAHAIGEALKCSAPDSDILIGPDQATILLLDDLNRCQLPIVRKLSMGQKMPFVIAMTEQPWELPVGLFRPDAFDAIWHLDLPDVDARAEFFDRMAERIGHANPGFDQVVVAHATYGCTYADLKAIYRCASRMSFPKPPGGKDLLTAIDGQCHLGRGREGELARLTAWVLSNAKPAT